MKKSMMFVFALLLTGLLVMPAFAAKMKGPQLIAAKFYADWCANCQAMNDNYERVKQAYADQDILFVTLDKTNEETSHQAKLLAETLNIDNIYLNHNKTGFVALIKNKNKSMIGQLSKDQSAEEMSEMIAEALEVKAPKLPSAGSGMKGKVRSMEDAPAEVKAQMGMEMESMESELAEDVEEVKEDTNAVPEKKEKKSPKSIYNF